MKKGAIWLSIFVLLLSLSFVLASNIVRFSNTVTEITVIEDTQTLLNVTVNNTHQITNITQVNITIPSTFTFTLNTNRTDSPVSTFANTTTVLSWENAALVQNASLAVREFNFNISASTPGKYNITVQTMNATSSTLLLTNLTVTINDTTSPATVTFASPSETAYANLSQTNLAVNVSATDNGVLDSVRFRIINSAGTLINSSNYSISAGSRFVNFTGFSDGTYNVTVTVNDTYNNLNTTAVRTVTLDTTAPSVTLTRSSSSTQNKLVVDISYTEATSGVRGACTHNRGSSASIEGTTFTETSLSCGESISLTIDCQDYASNTGTTTATFTTEACSTSSGTSSSSGSSTTTWTTTFADDNQELSAKGSIERSLKAKERVRVKVSGETHHVGVTSISSNSISVEISSTPQTATLAPGESKKFEVTGDNRYDLLVALTGISGGKANLAISSIDEQIPSSQADSDQAGSQGNQTGTPDSTSPSAGSKTTTIIVSIIVVLIIILLLVWWFARSRN